MVAVQRTPGLVIPLPGGQDQFLRDNEHTYVALEGGWGSGKTFAGACKLLGLHVVNSVDDGDSPTGCPSAVIAPTYANASDFQVPALQRVAKTWGLEWEWRASGTIAGGKYAAPALILPELSSRDEPSAILVRTADAPERITGWEVGAYWCDEPARYRDDPTNPSRDPLTQIKGRLRHPGARLRQGLYTYTNEGDATAVFREFHEDIGADHVIYRASTLDNPHVGGFAEGLLRNLPEELQRQYVLGEAISLGGMRAYPQFDEARHVVSAVTLDRNLPLDLALDFNINPGMHALLGQYRRSDDMLLTAHEVYGPRLDVRGAVDLFAQWVGKQGGWQWPELHVFGDATGRSGWAGTGESCYDVLAQKLRAVFPDVKIRHRVPPSNPPVADRLNAVNMALLDVAGKVHWQIAKQCERLRKDLRLVKRDAKGMIDNSSPDLTHASDADVYRVSYLRPTRPITHGSGGRWAFGGG